VYGRNVRKACDVFGRFLLLVKILCQIGRFTSFTTARFIKRALLLPTMESNYNPDALYTIAINNPAPGIECAVAHEIGQLPTTAEVWSARYSDTLATVSYTQCLPGSDAEPSVKENDPVGQLLESYNLDYLVISTEGKSDDPIAGILHGAMGFLANALVEHHAQQEYNGDSSTKHTDYELEIGVTELPRQDEQESMPDGGIPAKEEHGVRHRLPISRFATQKALGRHMAETGIIVHMYMVGRVPPKQINETAARTVIGRIRNWEENHS